jgi:hypothetical protein
MDPGTGHCRPRGDPGSNSVWAKPSPDVYSAPSGLPDRCLWSFQQGSSMMPPGGWTSTRGKLIR